MPRRVSTRKALRGIARRATGKQNAAGAGSAATTDPFAAPRPLQRFQWRLTLSYVTVTVLTTLVIEAVLIALGVGFFFKSALFPRLVAEEGMKSVAILAPPLEKTPPDVASVRRWMEARAEPPPGDKNDDENEMDFTLSLRSGVMMFAVIQGGGDAAPENAPVLTFMDRSRQISVAPRRAGDLVPVAHLRLLRRALQGESRGSRLSVRLPDSSIAFAIPIRTAKGKTVGAVYYHSAKPSDKDSPVAVFLGILLGSAVVVAAFSAVPGILFGFFTARRLIRRLNNIAVAADAWGRGDFSVTARDASPDELGILARRLNRMADQLREVVAVRQELATLEERNRLARDLHDTVKQQVFAASLQLSAAGELLGRDPDAAKARLEDARKLTGTVQQELTAMLKELRPAGKPAPDLGVQIREWAAEWSWRCGVQTEMQVEPLPPLSPATSQALFRIVQEALANVQKHSGASRVFIGLAARDGEVILRVADNGIGLPRFETGTGMGLQSMRERAEALPEGALVTGDGPEGGAEVIVSCRVDGITIAAGAGAAAGSGGAPPLESVP